MDGTFTMILADGNEICSSVYANAFERAGFNVTIADGNGKNLLEAIHRLNPDVVLMDLFLQLYDAIEVIKMADPALRTKYIVMSASENREYEKDCMRAGATYYVLKPFDIRHLISRIHAALSSETPEAVFGKNMFHDMEKMISSIMHDLGIPANLMGYNFIREGISIEVQDRDARFNLIKVVYPAIAKKFDSTPSRVERSMRNAIEIAWTRGDIDALNDYFGYTINSNKGKPTNGQFIAMIANNIRLELHLDENSYKK